jgi:uncharacterized C2H2 Zn-finger protein
MSAQGNEMLAKKVDNRKRNPFGPANGSGKFECHCGKAFSYKQGLNSHMKTHDDKFDAILRCSECGKKFSGKIELSRHVKSIHQGYFYECPICGNRQSDNSSSFKHIKKVHPGSVAKPIEKCEKQ